MPRPTMMPMKMPISVPPNARWRCGVREIDARRDAEGAVIEGLREAWHAIDSVCRHWKRAGRGAQALHLIRRPDAENREAVAQHLPDGHDQREPRIANARIVDQEPLRIIVTVKFLRQILQVEGKLMRREFARGKRGLIGEIGEATQKRLLISADERRRIDIA